MAPSSGRPEGRKCSRWTPSTRIDTAVTELTALGVQDIGTDRLRQVGRGQQPDVDQLCGKCARGVLMAKSRHKKPENLRRYFKPSDQALAEVTSLLAPGGSRR